MLGAAEPAKKMLQSRFDDLKLNCEAFRSLQYVGTQTKQPPTDYRALLLALKHQLLNKSRAARRPNTVFHMLRVLLKICLVSYSICLSRTTESFTVVLCVCVCARIVHASL